MQFCSRFLIRTTSVFHVVEKPKRQSWSMLSKQMMNQEDTLMSTSIAF